MSSILGKTLGQEAHGTGYDRLEEWFFRENNAARARMRSQGAQQASGPGACRSDVGQEATATSEAQRPETLAGQGRWRLVSKLFDAATRPRPTCIGQFPV